LVKKEAKGMNKKHFIKEEAWTKIYDYLKGFGNIYVKNESDCRRFVEGVFWMLKSGAQWRLLPESYGNWNTVYRRFADWSEKGIWYKMLYHFSEDADMEYIMIDSTILRAHACATPQKKIKNPKVSGVQKAGSRQKSTPFAMRSAIR
jgi:transposase